jgi:serine/threonine-protein kinase
MIVNGVPVQCGEVFEDKYRIERVLGQGGMGVVVAASHLQLQRMVAIKFLLPEWVDNAELVGRFVREARAAAMLESEHVARILDVGTSSSGVPYMVMEFLKGQDLGDLVTNGGPLPPSEAASYVIQACDAIAEAHQRGIVHRDLKPANLLLTSKTDGSTVVKVLDFGISKIEKEGAKTALTSVGAVMGSPLYMSPEQMRSAKKVDARTDIWALGVILFELMTARRPFEGDELPSVIAQVLSSPAPSMREFVPDINPDLDALVLRCLEKDVNQRVQTVGELVSSLQPFVQDSRLSSVIERVLRLQPASRPAFQSSPAATSNPAVVKSAPALQPDAPRSKLVPILASLAALGVCASSAYFVYARGKSQDLPKPDTSVGLTNPPAVLPQPAVSPVPSASIAAVIVQDTPKAPAEAPRSSTKRDSTSSKSASSAQTAPASTPQPASTPAATPQPAATPVAPPQPAATPVAPPAATPKKSPLDMGIK